MFFLAEGCCFLLESRFFLRLKKRMNCVALGFGPGLTDEDFSPCSV